MNTNRILRLIGAIMLMTTLGITGTAFAQTAKPDQPVRERRMERREKLKHALKELNLSADQKTKIKSLRQQFKSSHSAGIAQMKSLRGQMKQLKQSGGTPEQIKALRDQMKTERAKLQEPRKELRDQIKTVLTLEQLEELKKLRHDHDGAGKGGDIRDDGNPGSAK